MARPWQSCRGPSGGLRISFQWLDMSQMHGRLITADCLCRLTGKLCDGTVFADHQADDNLLEFVVGEGER